jgi:hypothetical protein
MSLFGHAAEIAEEEIAQLRVQVSRLELQLEEERAKRQNDVTQFLLSRGYEVDEQVKTRVEQYGFFY